MNNKYVINSYKKYELKKRRKKNISGTGTNIIYGNILLRWSDCTMTFQ